MGEELAGEVKEGLFHPIGQGEGLFVGAVL
jgi:hypothetical protein